VESGLLAFLALAAKARPGHCFEARFRDRLPAGFALTECASPDPSQGFLDGSEQTPIALAQLDLKLRFSASIGLVRGIALPASRSWYEGLGSASCG